MIPRPSPRRSADADACRGAWPGRAGARQPGAARAGSPGAYRAGRHHPGTMGWWICSSWRPMAWTRSRCACCCARTGVISSIAAPRPEGVLRSPDRSASLPAVLHPAAGWFSNARRSSHVAASPARANWSVAKQLSVPQILIDLAPALLYPPPHVFPFPSTRAPRSRDRSAKPRVSQRQPGRRRGCSRLPQPAHPRKVEGEPPCSDATWPPRLSRPSR
jgi:hypothetical protein